MNSPLVSVFIPYYNDQDFLANAIESVLKQAYPNWELILCNHASTDDSRHIAHSFQDKRIKHIDMLKNYGAGGGLVFETMLNASTGKYVKPFCADDALKPNCLEKMVCFLENNPKLDFAFCDIAYVDEFGKDLKNTWFNTRPDFSIQNDEIKLLKLYRKGIQTLPYIGSIVRRDALLNIHYDPSLIMLFDMSIWLQLLLQNKKMAYSPDVLAEYRCHREQVSGLKNEQIILRRSYFESPIFHDFFAKCKDVYLIKKVFSDSQYITQLKEEQDIPFIVYHAYFANSEELIHCYKLHELLDNKEYRQHLIKVFGYDIDNYRKEYSYPRNIPTKQSDKRWFKNLRTKVYRKPPKELNIFEITFLLSNRIFHILTLSRFRHRRKKIQKKKYSL